MSNLFNLTESILSNPVFVGLTTEDAEELASHCEVLLLPPKRKIFAQGDQANEMFVLFKGRLEIRVKDMTGAEHTVGVLEKGEIFGEMGVLDSSERSASCYTVKDSVLLRIPGEGFAKMIADSTPAVHRLLQFSVQKACARLRGLDKRLDELFLADKEKNKEI